MKIARGMTAAVALSSDLTTTMTGRTVDPARQARRRQTHSDHARVMSNLMYILSTGCQWRPSRKTCRHALGGADYFGLWVDYR
jgi:hypothetical protein